METDVFTSIESEIMRRTNLIKGEVSNEPIRLNLFSSEFADLQFLDLPGFIQVAREDRPGNMKQNIERMVKKHIASKNTIILAVSNAAVDLQNSKAWKIAREVDPEGNRIIGVLTNVDKVTGHTERKEKIVKVINNEIIPLKHGFFGVANRSQQQVDDKIPVKMCADMFEELIEDCSEYQDLKHRLGINNLVSFLGNSLANLVQQGWPKIKQELKHRHKVIENELRAMEGECNNQSMRSLRMITVLQTLEKEIRISIEGSSTCVNLEKVAIGAQMNYLIKEGAVKISENVRNTFAEEELSLMIANADINCYGARDQAMISREVLEIAVRILTEPYIGNTKLLTMIISEILVDPSILLDISLSSAYRLAPHHHCCWYIIFVFVQEINKKRIF